MTYAKQLDELTRHLAALLSCPPEPIDASAIQASLSGRKALLGLMTVQLHEVAPMAPTTGRPDFQGIAAHPVAALGAALRTYPRPDGEVAPSDLAATVQASEVGRLWVQVGQAASRAQAEWQGVGQRVDADQSWAVVADVAALAGALARLDATLASADPALGRDDLRTPLTTGQSLLLSVTAQEVLALAGTGSLPGDPPHRRRREPLALVVAGGPDGFVRAHQQSAELLAWSGPVKPEHVQQIAVALARSCTVTARAATGQGLDDLASVLKEQAEALGLAARHGRRAAMTAAGDPRPLAQASEVARAVRDGELPAGVTPHAAASALAAAVVSLSRTARRDLDRGLWLVPDDRDRAQYVWRHWRPGLDAPALAQHLDLAAASAGRVQALGPQYQQATSRRPHEALVDLEGSTTQPLSQRPLSPALRRLR